MRAKSGFWRKLRVAFRWLRITVWLAVLAVVCIFLWFNQIGLPDFLKTPLIEKLHDRGIELQFTRMRLHFIRGIIAENVRIGDARRANNPALSLAEVQVPVNFRAMLHRKLEIDGLVVRQGRFIWPISATNALTIENIQTDVRFQTNETWSLDRFTADFDGVKFMLSGDIAHAREIRNWEIFHGKETGAQDALQERLQQFSKVLSQIHFEGTPRISLNVTGDARDAGTFIARLNVGAPAVQTPWGSGRALQFAASVAVPGVSTNFNRAWVWWTNAQSSIELNGALKFADGEVLGTPIDSLRTHFYYSNLVWELPDLEMEQAKTQLKITGSEDDRTKQFYANIRGTFDPETIRPLLKNTNELKVLDRLEFSEPLIFNAQAEGRADDFDSINASGFLALTNFAVRTQAMESVTANFNYTNRVFTILHPEMFRGKGAQTMTADTVTFNFRTRLILFTNGFSTAEPVAFIRTIGPKTARLVEPYIQFASPPTVHIEGRLPLRDINVGHDMDDADLTFEILHGAPYHWEKLHTTNIEGTVRWVGQALVLSNAHAAFYGGHISGNATFDFRPAHHGADYEFAIDVVEADMHEFMADMISPTNKLEGVLSGQLFVTHASTEDVMTWNGFGHVNLRNGLIWEEPVFGFLSPVLNTVYPSLGNSRATAAHANFTITNGVIRTDSLEIRSTMVRLNYFGTVDLNQNLNAHVNGQLLRDLWGVGPVISTVLWPMSKLFEYHVTGTLNHPVSEPIYVPKFLLMPLHPIRAIEEILPSGELFTNPPPQN